MKCDYDLVVIGGGAAGLVAATGAASLGAKVAMIEKNKLGGDCTWYGCVPSKTLLKSSQALTFAKRIKDFGVTPSADVRYDASRVMSHVRDIIKKVSSHHPADVFEKRGIKVIFENPKFVDSSTVKVGDKPISSKRFIISTGSHPLVPPIEGLKEVDYLTNENIFDLEVLPRSLAVLGGGPIGVELSQALSRLGAEVTIIEMLDRLLFREDKEAALIMQDVLVKGGIKILTGRRAIKFSKKGASTTVTLEDKSKNLSVIEAEKALIAVGRSANVGGLNLEAAGVKYTNKGIEVDATLKTTANDIYACGDVVGPYQFSHMAEYQAVIAIGNALFPFKRKVDYSTVPWCTFTTPELAHLGMTEEEAGERYGSLKIYRAKFSESDRAVTDLEETGLTKVICDKKGSILGAHIVGANAGEIIHEYVLAKANKLKLAKISNAIHVYPTLAQLVKKTADQYYMGILQSKWFTFFSKLMLKFLR